MVNLKKLLLLASVGAAAALMGTPSTAATCVGNCGTSGADGVVSASPSGNATYDWVSTDLGQSGAGQLAGYGGTNGSELISDPFYASAGTTVNFFFNYVTSDGSGFADFAWSQLRTAGNDPVATLFTARTKPSGTIVPGQDLPGVEATLNPSSVPIIPNATTWSPLGGSSGGCFAAGCGSTGWIQSAFNITQAGGYTLVFGVSNWGDTALQSGMAFDGILVGGAVLGDGSSAEDPLLPADLGPNGEFKFVFEARPNVPVFIDPLVAVGYDYVVNSGPNILSAIFPTLAGDADGYEIYSLSDLNNPLFTGVLGGETVTFAPGGVSSFALRGINPAVMLDPRTRRLSSPASPLRRPARST